MDKIRTTVNEKVSKELMYGIFALVLMGYLVSVLVLGLYFFFAAPKQEWFESLNMVMLVIGLILLLLTSVLLFNYISNLKKAKTFLREVEYEFLDEELSYEVFRDGRVIEQGKMAYKDFLDYRTTKNYVFIRLMNNTFFVIDKIDGLTDYLESKGVNKKGKKK